jgi:hypothetical protein
MFSAESTESSKEDSNDFVVREALYYRSLSLRRHLEANWMRLA